MNSTGEIFLPVIRFDSIYLITSVWFVLSFKTVFFLSHLVGVRTTWGAYHNRWIRCQVKFSAHISTAIRSLIAIPIRFNQFNIWISFHCRVEHFSGVTAIIHYCRLESWYINEQHFSNLYCVGCDKKWLTCGTAITKITNQTVVNQLKEDFFFYFSPSNEWPTNHNRLIYQLSNRWKLICCYLCRVQFLKIGLTEWLVFLKFAKFTESIRLHWILKSEWNFGANFSCQL